MIITILLDTNILVGYYYSTTIILLLSGQDQSQFNAKNYYRSIIEYNETKYKGNIYKSEQSLGQFKNIIRIIICMEFCLFLCILAAKLPNG